MAWFSASLAALCVLTACGGSPLRPAERPAGTADVAEAPPPQNGPLPQEPPIKTRDVVKTASMTIVASDPTQAADKAALAADNARGRVDSRSEEAGSGTDKARTNLVLKVPTDKLDEVIREIKSLGTVERVEVTTEDVTAQRVDLDARMKALQTSVDRLLAIMRDARDPEALIKAEDALSERQAELDSLRAQRAALGDRIEYSTLNVTVVAQSIGGSASNQYHGFFGQVERGWNAMVSVARNLFLLFGLLLPWLGVMAVAGGVIYGIVRLTRRGRP